jgi:hypothetical protein
MDDEAFDKCFGAFLLNNQAEEEDDDAASEGEEEEEEQFSNFASRYDEVT